MMFSVHTEVIIRRVETDTDIDIMASVIINDRKSLNNQN